MALNWEILNEPHGLFVTCYRPIVIGVQVTGNQPAHIQGTLMVETEFGSGEYEDIGVRMNGYSDVTDNSDGYFSIDVADFCKNYYTSEPSFYNTNLSGNWLKMLSRAFKLRINPVIYQPNGALQVDYEDVLVTNSFIVSPTITKTSESTSMDNDYIRLDKFVNNGENNSSATWNDDADWNVLTTNMPQNNLIDIAQGMYYTQTMLFRGVTGRYNYVRVWNNTTGTSYDFQSLSSDMATHTYLYVHPVQLEFQLEEFNGSTLNHIINTTTGELQTDSMSVQYQYKNSSTYALERWSPKMTYKLVDGKCGDNETFIFRNMRGGIDWFIATGQKDKEVTISGDDYHRHVSFDRQYDNLGSIAFSSPFNVDRGAHSVTPVWNDVKETYKIFSQPVTKEYADWLQELIASPQVWVCRKISDIQGMKTEADKYKLISVNIIKNTYKLYTTEKNLHFVEFQYSLSENNLTQKL